MQSNKPVGADSPMILSSDTMFVAAAQPER
jgi:hypothetical protein